MAFDVAGAQAAGYSTAEIVDHLASSGPGFDVAGARKAGYSDAEILGHLGARQTAAEVRPDPITG